MAENIFLGLADLHSVTLTGRLEDKDFAVTGQKHTYYTPQFQYRIIAFRILEAGLSVMQHI